MTRNKN